MSREEKLREMEALWADLAKDDEGFDSPAWHEDALNRAKLAVAEGTATFSDWDEAKERLRSEAKKRT